MEDKNVRLQEENKKYLNDLKSKAMTVEEKAK